ncbi:Putative exonuclease, RdgC [Beggiatoa sp. PS]|nr:Putative exonuclease, RdgC [Beggiatoa sp. PS]
MEAGKVVTRLALEWNERLSFVLDNELLIRRIQTLDLLQSDANDSELETLEQKFEADFAIMTVEFASLTTKIFEIFGGEDEAAYAKMR